MRTCTLGILSDIHYASAAEQARGNDYEYRDFPNPVKRGLLRLHRRHFWLRDPLDKNYLLDRFLERAGNLDLVVAVGDYSCDSIFVGVSDDAAFASARECLGKLRGQFGSRFHPCFGDHELGKFSLLGQKGGLRLASWYRARQDLGLEPFWQIELGRYNLMAIVSTLVALPTFHAEMLEKERAEWEGLRKEHLAQIRAAFAALPSDRRVLLFCHDPTALPFLWEQEIVRARLHRVEATIVGHLHSNLIFRLSRLLSGMPIVGFLGHSAKRLSAALSQARFWRPFKVCLCPSLAGTELFKDGGYYTAEVPLEDDVPLKLTFHKLPR